MLNLVGTIISAVLALAGSSFGTWMAYKVNVNSAISELGSQVAGIKKDLANLTEKVAKQNSIDERVYQLERITAVQEERINRLLAER